MNNLEKRWGKYRQYDKLKIRQNYFLLTRSYDQKKRFIEMSNKELKEYLTSPDDLLDYEKDILEKYIKKEKAKSEKASLLRKEIERQKNDIEKAMQDLIQKDLDLKKQEMDLRNFINY